jgi:hypothetical protein
LFSQWNEGVRACRRHSARRCSRGLRIGRSLSVSEKREQGEQADAGCNIAKLRRRGRMGAWSAAIGSGSISVASNMFRERQLHA